MTTQISSKEIKKTKEVYYGNHCKQVEYGISVTNHAYFSVTGNIGYKDHRGNDHFKDSNGKYWKYECEGCIHDEILNSWPDMADIVSLHLSDIDGIPMYALENGYFYYTESSHHQYLQKHLRLNNDEYAAILARLDSYTGNKKDLFAVIVEELKPRWKAEANAVIEKYSLIS